MRQLLLPPLLLGLGLLASQVAAAKDPKITETSFGNKPPVAPIWFEDSDTALVTSRTNFTTFRSTDGGASWAPLDGPDPEEEVVEVQKHPFDKKTAVVLGTNKHWVTHDRGESWKTFESDAIPSFKRAGIAFHATDSKRMLFHVEECEPFCKDAVYYTTDSFNSPPKKLSDSVISCIWAKSSDIFTTGDGNLDEDRILCIAKGKLDLFGTRRRVVITDDYFDTHHEPVMSSGQTIEGVVNIASVKKYIVFASKGERTTEMAMYVTDDTKTWHRAEFGEHRVEEDAYTLLESTNYSMQVDVMTTGGTGRSMGVLLTSNSNGTFFTKNVEHTNRADEGFVDFEKIANIQGIVLVNVVQNWEATEAGESKSGKKLGTKISFDDGRTWQGLKAGTKDLHLHSVSEQRNTGRIFSSPAPGVVMGVGNTGDYLKSYEDGDLYISTDAGLTWTSTREKPHFYEFGAQGSILVAIRDAETDSFQWSTDFGKHWETAELGAKIKPSVLTITPDSTSLKFMLVASKGDEYVSYSLNFEDLDMRECKSKDLETWYARVDEKGEPTCIMGHKQSFQRRKADADCVVVSENFEDPEEEREQCVCTEEDFECDYNYKKDDGKCVATDRIVPPEGACKGDAKKYMGPSGYRLIPGNSCKVKDVDLTKEVERDCKESASPPASGEIAIELTRFPGDKIVEYFYLERDASSSGDDETIIMRTNKQQVWFTKDHGKTWAKVAAVEDEKVAALYPNQYNIDSVYMVTTGKKVFYSVDRLRTVHSFDVDHEPARDVQVLTFHPDHSDWLIWTGQRDCDSSGRHCEVIAQYSAHRGDKWDTLLHGVRKCEFVYRKDRKDSEKLIYCEQYEDENPDNRLVLKSSIDHFETFNDLKRDVINFATMAEYIVVAVTDDDKKSLKVDTSIDGVTFADAKFPHNFNPDHQTAYTVLDSSTHAIFLHVTVQDKKNQEYGSIIKSNSNGTNYVLTASEVNRSPLGYVDFEKMQGVEGVAVINRVTNKKEVDNGKAKKLQTFITHNDGATWSLLGRPADPPSGKSYDCKKGSNIEKCSLHLHGYTERDDPRHTYSSPTAVGLMMGTGNVGDSLKSFEEADTFLSRDGGLTWEFAAEGNWMWDYGDMGSIIVIVKKGKTDLVKYSLDEGRTWQDQPLGKEINVNEISTVPSDTSRNFILWGEAGDDPVSVNIDFTGLKERSEPCKLDEQHPGQNDYELWSPKHPTMDDDCLFGHVSQYHRKKPDAKCYNGKELQAQLSHLHNIAKNCTCTREDFECDYNYEADSTGTCKLVKGLQKSDPAAVCKENPELTEYNGITGYRRIPLTTCSGGKEYDYTSVKHPCPGKEDDFNKKHGISGAGLFFAIVIPIAAAAGVGYWVWKNWDGKFGQIRLGDGGANGFGGAFDGEAPWVKYPVMALSGLVAVVAAIPMLVGSLWKAVSTRLGRSGGYARPYTSRSSFQRGRGDYAVVDEDEGFLGDSDEDL